MIGVAMYITIKSLWERHKNKSLIAKLTGHDWKTVAKRIKEIEEGKEYPKKKPHPRILDSHKEQIMEWLKDNLSGVRIHEKLREEGVKLGYSTVKDYICKIKKRDNVFILPSRQRKHRLILAISATPHTKEKREKPGSLIRDSL